MLSYTSFGDAEYIKKAFCKNGTGKFAVLRLKIE